MSLVTVVSCSGSQLVVCGPKNDFTSIQFNFHCIVGISSKNGLAKMVSQWSTLLVQFAGLTNLQMVPTTYLKLYFLIFLNGKMQILQIIRPSSPHFAADVGMSLLCVLQQQQKTMPC